MATGEDGMLRIVAACVALTIGAGAARAAGDFPLASCKGWDGTVVERGGVDTERAFMRGIVTQADMREYCDRDPGGETRAYGGKLSKSQCVERHLAEERRTRLVAEANCLTGQVSYRYGDREPLRARFPLGRDADASCASGMPPLVRQFKALCPAAAARLRLPD